MCEQVTPLLQPLCTTYPTANRQGQKVEGKHIIFSDQNLITALEPDISSCHCCTSHCFMAQSDVQTIGQQRFRKLCDCTITCMSGVYQVRSSEDHSGLCSIHLLVYSPHLCLSGLKETDPWVWGLEYVSAGANQRSIIICECVYVFVGIFIIANLSSCHSSNLVSGSNSLQEYPIFTAVSTTIKNEGAG